MKTEILETIIGIVAEVCEVPIDKIKSMNKCGDVVEARSMFVHFCYAYGIQPICMMRFLNRKRLDSISDAAHNFHAFSKQSYSFRLMSGKVADKLAAIYPRQ